MLILMASLHAIFHAFHHSAFDSSYSMIVHQDQLARANGMMQTTGALSGILAPGVAAAIISLPELARQGHIGGNLGHWFAGQSNGTALAFAIDAITFFFAAVVPLFLFVPSPQRSDPLSPRKDLWSDIRTGAQFIWLRRPMLWLLATFTVANFTSSPMFVLMPLLLKFNLAADWALRGFTFETATAFLATASSVGGLVGGILISAWGGLKTRKIYGVVLAILASGVCLILLGASAWFYMAVAISFLSAGLIPVMNSHSQAIWQTQTPHALQGRVFAVRRLIAQFTWPLSTAMAGFVGGVLDVGILFMILGSISALFCVFQLFNPVLHKVEDKTYLDALAHKSETS
jgi:hypothetical protein